MSPLIKNTFLTIVSLLLFTACDKDVTGVTYVTHLTANSGDIVVNDPQSNQTNTFNVEFQVNLENEETRKYLDQITDFELEEISLYFSGLQSLEGNNTPTHLKISIDNDIEFEYNDFVYDLVATGNAFQIKDTEKINEIAELLFNNKHIDVKIEGEIPDDNYFLFNIEADVLAKIEVNTP